MHMSCRYAVRAAFLLLAAYFQISCDALERDNPLDADGQETAVLALVVPLPKYLADVVQKVVARLEGPDMAPIVKELSRPPLGPATGTIGAIPPGIGRILTVEGFDLQGELLFRGERRDLTIRARDTTRVEIDLVLVQAGGTD